MTTRRVVLDVSSNNGLVDFATLRREHPEVLGVFAKATEGESYFNPLFGAQIANARAAGLLTGAYAFAHPSNAGTVDVQKFLSDIGATPMELGTAWDCEVSDGLPPATVLARFLEDLAALARDPRKDLIYTGKWFWDPQTLGSVAAHVERFSLWVSSYRSTFDPRLALPVPWTSCRFWQFTDNYFGTGIDASVWMGTDVEWLQWVGGTNATPPPSGGGQNRYNGFPMIRRGSRDPQPGSSLVDRTHPVTSLQNALNIVRGHEAKTDPFRLAADGDFGPATDVVVRGMQGDYHLPVDGIAGPLFWALMGRLLTAKKR